MYKCEKLALLRLTDYHININHKNMNIFHIALYVYVRVCINLVFNFYYAVASSAVLQSDAVERFAAVFNVPNRHLSRICTHAPHLLPLTQTHQVKQGHSYKIKMHLLKKNNIKSKVCVCTSGKIRAQLKVVVEPFCCSGKFMQRFNEPFLHTSIILSLEP